jgi:predicted O-methyltransferase YrrM
MNWQWSGEVGMDLHEALRVACALLKKVNSYLEIGVDGGGSLNTVLCEGVPSRIVLCDIWDPAYCDHGDAKPQVLKVLEYFKASAKFLDGDSKELIPTLYEQFDLVLVDGDHSGVGAQIDLQNAWPLVRTGGILVMDDINHPNYPWLSHVWEANLARWRWTYSLERIAELHGGCNAAMVMKL